MALTFTKVSSAAPVAEHIAHSINEHLERGETVLWLVSGGSAVAVAVAAAGLITAPAAKLTITLADERYGEPGHSDSNWQQLMAAGFIVPGALLLPVLRGLSQDDTAQQWGSELDQLLQQVDYKLGLLGVGPDGHTAGVLPGTPAVYATGTAYAYDGGTYQRITMTLPAVARLDEVVAYLTGAAKHPVIDALGTSLDLHVQPAQILGSVRTATIFNDYKGE